MRAGRSFAWGLLVFLICRVVWAAAGPGVIRGIVRNQDGKPIAGVSITLMGQNATGSSKQTTSGPAGDYRFDGLSAGDYALSAALPGYGHTSSPVLHVPGESDVVAADLVLANSSSVVADRAATPSGPAPQFEASSIRGLIDPGGYSASATAAAASGLVRGVADIRRVDKSLGTVALKDWPCAMEPQLRSAVQTSPDQAEANRRLGLFYVVHRQPANAIPLLKRALQADPTDYDASHDLVLALLQDGEFNEARNLLLPLMQRYDKPETHELLARADEGLGMFQQAAQEYRNAANGDLSEENLFGIGYELILAGSVKDALTAFEAGEQQYPRSIPLRIGSGTAQFLLGHTSDGVRTFLAATDTDPADPRPYAFLAAASGISTEESERVRNSFRRFLDVAPDNADANYYYAVILSREHVAANPVDSGRIEELLKRAILLNPGLAKAHLQLADQYAHRGDFDDAVPEYETAVRLAPDLTEAHYRLAIAYRRLGRSAPSAREMQTFLQTNVGRLGGRAGTRIDVAQFVSVMDPPEGQRSLETQCSVSPH